MRIPLASCRKGMIARWRSAPLRRYRSGHGFDRASSHTHLSLVAALHSSVQVPLVQPHVAGGRNKGLHFEFGFTLG
jgi:hypothetical protein